MTAALQLALALVLSATPQIETQFAQVAPEPRTPTFTRSSGQTMAIVLIHGLRLHPWQDSKVYKPELHGWQEPKSTLVKELSKLGDVYAFAYSQNAAVEKISEDDALLRYVSRLRELGYREIALVGHSAGGLIARQFVEDHPEAGVTRVIQVCTPNAGSALAKSQVGVSNSQNEFLHSLSKEARAYTLYRRAEKKIPPHVQFVCVVGCGEILGDGVVTCHSQWPEDLQVQGIPAVPLASMHFWAMRTGLGASKIATLLREDQPRWDAAHVVSARKTLIPN